MSSIPQVLHRTAKPVSVAEFVDAVRAICLPRFPGSRGRQARPVGLAISGGVDSMALAYLCSQLHKDRHVIKVADNPVGAYHCMIVDHRTREGSDLEAEAVHASLASLGLKTHVMSIGWKDFLQGSGYSHPKELPNFETVARRLRYRKMAVMCAKARMASLFFAHHEDDQYETVLMRLVSGHGAAGLLGMRPAADIPESYDIHGAYQSGLIDDQSSRFPMINYRPMKGDLRSIRHDIMADIDPEVLARERLEGTPFSAYLEDELDSYVPRMQMMLPVAPPKIEDGGVFVYRPLLEFSKDRLIATCEANRVPWFEDATNQDATLTMRNAVRHVHRHHTLPAPLQKPAILDMSRRLRGRAELEEAEVDRLLARTMVRDFESIAGTVVVQLPSFRIPRSRRGLNPRARRTRRLERYRYIAGLLLKRLIAMVTPEQPGTFATSLQNQVVRLFPSLNDDPSTYPEHPKAFNVSSVHFLPVRTSSDPGAPMSWYLTREPYVSGRPPPVCSFGRLSIRERWRRRPEVWRWPLWKPWQLWDGRFWVRVRNRSSVHAAVAPFEARYAKAFRDSLPDDRARAKLAALLKHHAPGKVRYTLPAIYTGGDHERAVQEVRRRREAEKEGSSEEPRAKQAWRELGYEAQRDEYLKMREWEKEQGIWDINYAGAGPQAAKKVLVALPTLGISKPGLNSWIRYEIRYRRVDSGMLENTARDERQLAWFRHKRSRTRTKGCAGQTRNSRVRTIGPRSPQK
ncbi:hypothetical protein KVR01_006386 [Diaporthe batatas]|uniref:uncharacterized protein n=1 Tax=Diaporthe batatas TaxID=748121 RepID=UPI001D053349|nr:uncharacterized protein KVR01_006386 [Diaporthe batatas]KAG8164468.1 hypothetical protein KVR01_006386 [Diaporthe batatas]